MTVPLIVLAILSIVGGFIGIPEIFSGEHGNLFHSWLEPIFKNANRKLAFYGSHTQLQEILLMVVSVSAAIAAILFARYVYLKRPSVAVKTSQRFAGIYKILLNKYYVDETYDALVVNPIKKSSESFLWKIADNKIIDGMVNGAASLVNFLSDNIKKMQTGIAQFYAIVMMLGIVVALFWIMLSL